MQPRASNVGRCASIAAVTRGSTGRPPKVRFQAIRTPLKSRPRGRAKVLPGAAILMGTRRCRTEADDIAEAGGIAQGAADVSAISEGQHATRQGDRGATAAAAACL